MRSLRRRFIVAALVTQLVVALALVGALYRLLDGALHTQLQLSAERSRSLLAGSLEPLLIERDLAGAQELAGSLVESGQFLAIEVTDAGGRQLVAAGRTLQPVPPPGEAPSKPSQPGGYHLSTPLTAGRQPLGQLHFVLSTREVDAAKQALVLWLVLLGAGGLTLGATLNWFLARRLTRRVEVLADAAGRVAAGGPGVQLPEHGRDEVAQLTQAFNRMSTTIEQRIAALQASEQRQRELTEALAEGIVFQGPDNRVLSCNDAAARILGLAREQLLGLSSIDPRWHAVHPDGSPFDPAQQPSVVAQRTGQPVRNVLMGIDVPDVGRRWLSINSQPLLDPVRGGAHATVTSFSDITARVEAEQALEQANEQLEQRVLERTAELERARDVAEEASRAKSAFLSRMSHELRTPLNAILGFTQVLRLRMRDGPPEVDEQLGHIETAGWHLLELIDDVLDLARIESGTVQVELQPIELAPLVAECLRMVQRLADERGVVLVDRSAALHGRMAQADARRLRQVLVNLLSNACKYNRRGGQVLVHGAIEGDETLVLAVEDTGVGMDAAQQASLFEPFNRLGAERSGVEGTGIGLVIARHLVELMGGRLLVHSTPGVGSRFEVRLPGIPAVAGSRPPVPPLRGPRAADADPGGGSDHAGSERTLLYIEDNPSNVALLEDLVRLRPGVRLLVASDGRSGIALARERAPHAVVVDIALPDIDGYHVCGELRALPALAGRPVIALSANAMPSDIERGRAAGFDHFLTKPVDVPAFLRWLDQALPA